MPSTITDTHRAVAIADVRAVVVTDIVTSDGVSSRAIRILGEPVADGTPTEIMQIVIRSGSKTDLEMKAPEQRF
jgi:hypothetical protein